MADRYDPYENRVVERPTSKFETSTHIIKGVLGTGLLASPQAFSNTGWIVGVTGSILLTLFIIYCTLLLLSCNYELCKQEKVPNLSYGNTMKIAFSQGPNCMKCLSGPSPFLTDFFLIFYQTGICVVYVVFIGENTKQLFDEKIIKWDARIWMVLWFLPLLALGLIPDLKKLSPASYLGNILVLIALSFVLVYVFKDLPLLGDREKSVDFMRFPLYLGSFLFSLSPAAVVVTIEANMRTPKDFGGVFGVLSLTIFASAVLYIFFGFFGFWKYGQNSKGSTTLNLPENEGLAITSRVLYVFSVWITFPLQAFISLDIIWNQYLKERLEGNKKQTFYYYLIRILNAIFVVLLAIAVPRLGLFISFIGVFAISALGFIFPGLLHICLLWPDRLGWLKWILVKDCIIIIFGLFGLACGTYVSVRDIIVSFK